MRAVIAVVVCLSASGAFAAGPTSEDEKALYMLGQQLGQSVAQLSPTSDELEVLLQGLTDAVKRKKPALDAKEGRKAQERLTEVMRLRMERFATEQRQRGETFLENEKKSAKTPPIELPGGALLFHQIQPAEGASPSANSRVRVQYQGQLWDGTNVESTYNQQQAPWLSMRSVIACWTDALPLMKVGGKARLICPSERAYGERGAPPKIPPGAVLVFNIELRDVQG